MRGYLLDTNHLSHAVTRSSIVRQRIADVRVRGVKVGTCVPVLCELEAGIQQISQPEAYRVNLRTLLRQVRIWPIDAATARHYGIVHRELKLRGRVLSQVDMMLAAMARQMDVTILTTDHDFAALPDVQIEDWRTT